MPDIVKYHNDLNRLKFYLFRELEQNILMGVFLNARFNNMREFVLLIVAQSTTATSFESPLKRIR